ncbi:MAG: glycoside hydrolase family 3 protein [Spirochaetia bacterium]
MWHRIILSAVNILCVTVAASAVPAEGLFWSLEYDRPEDAAAQLVSEMSDEEIVAQTFLMGWPSIEPTDELLEWVRRRNIGGIKLFGWNSGDLSRLAGSIGTLQQEALDSAYGIPMLTATDQEGGWVRHIRGSTAVTPGNMAIGATGLPYDAYKSGYYIGRELRALGINMNFAPTVDVYRNFEAHVIGPRSFGSDPIVAGTLGGAYVHGLEDSRVISTAKHFPGHGGASGDSHGILPVLSASMDELWDRDLVPYRMLIADGLPAILSGHLSFPEITGDGTPASVSSVFKQQLLRDRLGFEGIVVTDDLHMGGATTYAAQENLSFAELCLEALKAGSDMILLSQTPDPDGDIWQTILSEYRTNETFRTRLRRSVERVLTVKLRYLRPDNRVPLIPDTERVDERIPDPEGEAFFRDQAYRSATAVRDADIPFRISEDESVLLAGKDEDFLRIGQERYPEADVFRMNGGTFYSPAPDTPEDFRQTAGEYDVVLFCLSDPATLSVLSKSEDMDARIAVISTLTPVYLSETPWIDSAVAVYGWGVESLRAGYAVLSGEIAAEGRLPVDME